MSYFCVKVLPFNSYSIKNTTIHSIFLLFAIFYPLARNVLWTKDLPFVFMTPKGAYMRQMAPQNKIKWYDFLLQFQVTHLNRIYISSPAFLEFTCYAFIETPYEFIETKDKALSMLQRRYRLLCNTCDGLITIAFWNWILAMHEFCMNFA